MLALAKEKGLKEVKANIYSFNTQSQQTFESVGFQKVSEEWYSCQLDTEVQLPVSLEETGMDSR